MLSETGAPPIPTSILRDRSLGPPGVSVFHFTAFSNSGTYFSGNRDGNEHTSSGDGGDVSPHPPWCQASGSACITGGCSVYTLLAEGVATILRHPQLTHLSNYTPVMHVRVPTQDTSVSAGRHLVLSHEREDFSSFAAGLLVLLRALCLISGLS